MTSPSVSPLDLSEELSFLPRIHSIMSDFQKQSRPLITDKTSEALDAFCQQLSALSELTAKALISRVKNTDVLGQALINQPLINQSSNLPSNQELGQKTGLQPVQPQVQVQQQDRQPEQAQEDSRALLSLFTGPLEAWRECHLLGASYHPESAGEQLEMILNMLRVTHLEPLQSAYHLSSPSKTLPFDENDKPEALHSFESLVKLAMLKPSESMNSTPSASIASISAMETPIIFRVNKTSKPSA